MPGNQSWMNGSIWYQRGDAIEDGCWARTLYVRGRRDWGARVETDR